MNSILIDQLEDAIRDADQRRALDLARQIEQQLVFEWHEHATMERRVRELLGALEQMQRKAECPGGTSNTDFSVTGDIRRFPRLDRRLHYPRPFDPEHGHSFPEGDEVDEIVRASERSATTHKAIFPVWFGTNRKPDGRGGFGTERHERTTCGRVEVLVPEAHRFGEIGSSFWRKLLRFDLRDDRLRVQRVSSLERYVLFSEIRAAMQDARESGETAHALFFLHGFNVSFEEAAVRTAQIGFDLKVPGATAFFSWPSRGTVTGYTADEATIEASERAITDFLVDFAANCGAEKIHVMAHSMGNRGLLRAIQRIAADALTRGKVKFGQIFLAAPDLDRDLFLDLARLYPEHAERTTLYSSDADRAVHLSSRLHDAPRAGYFVPYTVASGVDTIAVPNFDIDLLGHGYFAAAEALLHDIYDLIRHGQAPAKRQRIAPFTHDGMSFWKLKR